MTAYGTVDEANAAIGLAVVALQDSDGLLRQMLLRIQNDLFDLGADLCVTDRGEKLPYEPLRIAAGQVDRLEAEIDQLNQDLEPLKSFVLPGGSPAAAALHQARTIVRRAERLVVELAAEPDEPVSEPAIKFVNRLSDLLFVAAPYTTCISKLLLLPLLLSLSFA